MGDPAIEEALDELQRQRLLRGEIHKRGGKGMSDDEMTRLEEREQERLEDMAFVIRVEKSFADAKRERQRIRDYEEALVEQGRREKEKENTELKKKLRLRRLESVLALAIVVYVYLFNVVAMPEYVFYPIILLLA